MEEWRFVVGYNDYQVSNLGRVKSLKLGKERILKKYVNCHGYCEVALCGNGNQKLRKVHQLVAESFLNYEKCNSKLVVNHINFIKDDNNVENLEVVSIRENSNKKHIKSSSKYVGVSWYARDKKWRSRIVINGKQKLIGMFEDELDAHNAYQNELKNLL
jgi:hypothetical protein